MGVTLHLKDWGKNDHHRVEEVLFKTFGRTLRGLFAWRGRYITVLERVL